MVRKKEDGVNRYDVDGDGIVTEDELKVTRQFLNKLTQKSNIDGQEKML